mgnify:CR=1 FL=1
MNPLILVIMSLFGNSICQKLAESNNLADLSNEIQKPEFKFNVDIPSREPSISPDSLQSLTQA